MASYHLNSSLALYMIIHVISHELFVITTHRLSEDLAIYLQGRDDALRVQGLVRVRELQNGERERERERERARAVFHLGCGEQATANCTTLPAGLRLAASAQDGTHTLSPS